MLKNHTNDHSHNQSMPSHICGDGTPLLPVVSSNPAGANAADGKLHLMVFFAHPVDWELKAEAVVAMWANLRQKVKLVSTTNPAPPNSINYSECDSNRTFITHLISDSAGSKIWDVGIWVHGMREAMADLFSPFRLPWINRSAWGMAALWFITAIRSVNGPMVPTEEAKLITIDLLCSIYTALKSA